MVKQTVTSEDNYKGYPSGVQRTVVVDMASSENGTSPSLGDLMVCSVCKKGFGSGDGLGCIDPLVLPCLHTMCSPCLARHVHRGSRPGDSTFKCPACSHALTVPPGGIQAFPRDTFKPLLQKTLNGTSNQATAKPPSCGLHPKEGINLYCGTCQAPICTQCSHGDHKDHKVLTLKDASNKLDAELNSSTKTLICTSASEVEAMLDNLQRSKQNMEADFQDTRMRVKQRAFKLCAEIRQAEAKHIEEIDALEEERSAQITKIQNNLETFRNNIQALSEYSTTLHNRGTDYDKSVHIPAIKDRLRSQTDVQLETVTWESQMLTSSEHMADIYRLLGKVDIKEKTVLSYLGTTSGLFEGLHLKESIQLQCSHAKHLVVALLFGNNHLLHCGQEKLCFHGLNGNPEKEIKVPGLCFPRCPAIVDSSQGKLALVDLGVAWTGAMDDECTRHVQGSLHWLVLNTDLSINKHDIIQLQCMPTSVSVDNSGQILVTALCTTTEHSPSILIFQHNGTLIRDIQLQVGLLRFPAAVARTGAAMFAVLDWGNEQVAWVNQHGRVIQTYGKTLEMPLPPQPTTPLSPKCFEILDSPNSHETNVRRRLDLSGSTSPKFSAPKESIGFKRLELTTIKTVGGSGENGKNSNSQAKPSTQMNGTPLPKHLEKSVLLRQLKEKASRHRRGRPSETSGTDKPRPARPHSIAAMPQTEIYQVIDSRTDPRGPTKQLSAPAKPTEKSPPESDEGGPGSGSVKKTVVLHLRKPNIPKCLLEVQTARSTSKKPSDPKDRPKSMVEIEPDHPSPKNTKDRQQTVASPAHQLTNTEKPKKNLVLPGTPQGSTDAGRSQTWSPKQQGQLTPKTPTSPVKHVEENLGGPQHMVLHPDGSLLIADCDNHRVHLVSPEGKLVKYLLGRKDGLRKPKYLYLDPCMGLLYVRNGGDRGLVQVFKYNTRHSLDTQLTLKLHMCEGEQVEQD